MFYVIHDKKAMGVQLNNSQLIGNDGKNQYYCVDGVYLVRKLYKHPKGLVNSSDDFVNTRLAGIEFAACSTLAAGLYKEAKLYLPYLHKWYAMAKFTAALRKVVNGCKADAGERDLIMSKHKGLALGIELNSKCNFVDVFKMPFVIDFENTTKELVIKVNDFIPADLNIKDTGASMLRLFCFVVIVEDMELDAATKTYIAKQDLTPITSRFCFSEYISLLQGKNKAVSLKMGLNDVLKNKSKAGAWLWLGAELCRKNNNAIEVLYNSSVCKLVQVVDM